MTLHIYRIAHVMDGTPDRMTSDTPYCSEKIGLFDWGDGHWWGDYFGGGGVFGNTCMGCVSVLGSYAAPIMLAYEDMEWLEWLERFEEAYTNGT